MKNFLCRLYLYINKYITSAIKYVALNCSMPFTIQFLIQSMSLTLQVTLKQDSKNDHLTILQSDLHTLSDKINWLD